MKKHESNLEKPLSERVRGARRHGRASARARRDLEALVQAYLEAGHLSESDLKGEISMLRSVLRRVFALTNEASDLLEEQEEAQQGAGQIAGNNSRRGLKKKTGQQEDWHQPRLFGRDDVEPLEEDARRARLELWAQSLESLSRGTMRLANLMRTHQALNRAEAEETRDSSQVDSEEEANGNLDAISQKLEQAQSELSQDQRRRE